MIPLKFSLKQRILLLFIGQSRDFGGKLTGNIESVLLKKRVILFKKVKLVKRVKILRMTMH